VSTSKSPILGSTEVDRNLTAETPPVLAPGESVASSGTRLRSFQSLPEPDDKSTILLVDGDDLSRQLIRAMLKATPYRIREARRPQEALHVLDVERIDLVIVDLVMPEMDGAAFCRRVKANRRTQFIPILMLTSVQGVENEITGLDSGADEYLTKPLQPALVRTRIRGMLRNKRAVDTLEQAETILFALAQAVEARDKETHNHCQRLTAYAVALGRSLGLSDFHLVALYRGGYLHDIGKICVPDEILFKPGRLNEEEWIIMKEHTVKGEQICRPMRTLEPVLPIIRHHHERWDGSGYPDGLAGDSIPLLARVLQLADIYDALTSCRAYKPSLGHHQALDIMRREAARTWRDPELVSLFCEVFREPLPPESIEPSLDLFEKAPQALDVNRLSASLVKMNRVLLGEQNR
jgi:putative two-component system response regulator